MKMDHDPPVHWGWQGGVAAHWAVQQGGHEDGRGREDGARGREDEEVGIVAVLEKNPLKELIVLQLVHSRVMLQSSAVPVILAANAQMLSSLCCSFVDLEDG